MIMDCAKYAGPCECGRTHELETKMVVVEYGAVKNFEKYMEEVGLAGKKRTVVYDSVIYKLTEGKHVAADQEIVLEAKGLRAAPMGQLHYDESYVKDVNEAGETTYTLSGSIAKNRRQSQDYELLEQGYATMTVLHFDMPHREATDALSQGE